MTHPLTPSAIVAQLDRHIVGQNAAKRAVAIALRNRWRRRQLAEDVREEVIPKNILMIGSTGIGKTEIARRLARLAQAPFVKVEATKFTEVGYVGRDVESMVRDITDAAIRMVEEERFEEVQEQARRAAVEKVLDALAPETRSAKPSPPQPELPPHLRSMSQMFQQMGVNLPEDDEPPPPPPPEPDPQLRDARRHELRQRVEAGDFDDQPVTIEVTESHSPVFNIWAGQSEEVVRLEDALGGMMPKQNRPKQTTVAEAIELLTRQEAEGLIDRDRVLRDAIERAENDGIIFIDELDKVCGGDRGHGPDVSREGVQRDILPVVEGTTVVTKFGPVNTRHMLFIAAGAFHVSKPSDLIPELQGRFPIRVELESLTTADLRRILSEPEHALTKQYQLLLGTEGVTVEFRDDAIEELADLAAAINQRSENIGARRLYTVLETLLEELSFAAPDIAPTTVVITREYVRQRLSDIAEDEDLSRYIL